MASTYGYPVLYSKEGNTWKIFGHVTFGATGVPSLDSSNSKGICSIANETVVFSGATTSSSLTITSVSSFNGLYTGMALTGASGFQANTTIGTISASTGSIVLTQAVVTGSSTGSLALFASGGRYRIQFGQQAASRVDTYVKLLNFDVNFSCALSSASGSVGVVAQAPAANVTMLVNNNVRVKTIPATLTSGSTDASVAIQFGVGTGVNFVAVDPVKNESIRFGFTLGNLSTAPGNNNQ